MSLHIQEGTGTPVGSVTPTKLSQHYTDISNGHTWISYGLTDTDWVEVGSGAFSGQEGLWENFAEGIRPIDNKEIAVGRFNGGAESVFGEGDSHQVGLKVFTYNSTTGTYLDETANALIQGDSNSVSFPSVTADNAIYVGTTEVIWYNGIKINVTQMINIGTGSVAKEYWNGSAWVEFTTMATNADYPHQSYAEGIGTAVGSFQVRYNHFLSKDWTTKEVNGVTTYWTRYRIKTAISQSLEFDYLKLGTNRFEINSTAVPEFFGWGRFIDQFNISFGSFQAAGNSPSNADVYIEDKIDIGRIENRFVNGAVDRSGFTKILPLNLDTSTPIKFRVKWQVEGSSSGNVKFVIRWAPSNDGVGVYYSTTSAPTTAENSQTLTGIVPVSANSENKEITTDVYLDVSNYIPERGPDDADSIWLSFERPSTDQEDDFDDDVIINDVEVYYIAWRLGGMVVNY